MDNQVTWRIGKTLDRRYEIKSILGIGGMAVVYLAYDTKLNRNVAVKVLKNEAVLDEESRRRFRTEYQAIGVLSHPNIRAVYDVVSSGPVEYIVMEYVDGTNLKKYLQQKKYLSWEETLHFAMQVSKALAHAHSKGVIHMDIKPHNIMLSNDNTAKLADFGIARFDTHDPEESAGETVGSIHYISPEQARGESVDARSDIYSFGVVMYEMLTGRLPFTGETVGEVAIQHFAVVPKAPTSIHPEIPPELEAITMKAMQPHPEDRYQTADELVAALEQFRVSMAEAKGSALAESSQPEVKRSHEEENHSSRGGRLAEFFRDLFVYHTINDRRIAFFLGLGVVLVCVIILFVFVWNNWLLYLFIKVEYTEVPDFVGYKAADVTENEDITKLFNFTVEYQTSDDYEEGVIIGQVPTAGTSSELAPERIDVTLVVSSGSNILYVEMPNLVYHPYTEAQVQLQTLGFEVEIVMEESVSVTADNVISTIPAAGESVPSGSTVILFVSAGPSLTYVDMPDLIGLSEVEARAAIYEAGLMCTDTDVDYVESSNASIGLVVWQNYEAGTKVLSGTYIYIQVGLGVITTPTPEPTETPEPTDDAEKDDEDKDTDPDTVKDPDTVLPEETDAIKTTKAEYTLDAPLAVTYDTEADAAYSES